MGLGLATSLEHRSLGGSVFPLHRDVEVSEGSVKVGGELDQPLAQQCQFFTLQLRHLVRLVLTWPRNFLGAALQADTQQNSSQTMRRYVVSQELGPQKASNCARKCPACSSSFASLPEQRIKQLKLANRGQP